MRIAADLHVHTNASDGVLSPSDVVRSALSAGLEAVAVTDHDTVSGIPEAMEASTGNGIRVISGVELSAHTDKGTLHILGFFPAPPGLLEAALGEYQLSRRRRITVMVARLNALGMGITEDDVLDASTGTQPGRPHVARALVQHGHAHSVEEAFDLYLGKGRPAYVPREKPYASEAIRLIRENGGMSVLAHPWSLGMDEAGLGRLVAALKVAGLCGIEAFHPRHASDETGLFLDMAGAMGLAVTGGSDFHGGADGGCPIGGAGLDREMFASFLERLAAFSLA